MSTFTLILLLVAIGWFWLDSLRAREIATAICRQACATRSLQFLDQTVALAHVGIVRAPGPIKLRRVYRFDYSEEGTGRHTGHIVMIGTELEQFSLGLPSDTESG